MSTIDLGTFEDAGEWRQTTWVADRIVMIDTVVGKSAVRVSHVVAVLPAAIPSDRGPWRVRSAVYMQGGFEILSKQRVSELVGILWGKTAGEKREDDD